MCGLVGFYPKPGKKVDFSKIFPLWVMNEERGAHSCGISIGSSRYIGVDTLKKARDFMKVNRGRFKSTANEPVICHTRHATYGTHIDKNAHPFVWTLTSDDDKYFSFAHNGTITNKEELIKKFNLSAFVDDNVIQIDSHALGLAVYKSLVRPDTVKLEDILKLYRGAAAFLGYNQDRKFLVWKGANNDVEERPMYYIENDSGWYFCSIEEALNSIFPTKYVVKVRNNELLTFEDGVLMSSTIISREYTIPVSTCKAYNKTYNSLNLFTSNVFNEIKAIFTNAIYNRSYKKIPSAILNETDRTRFLFSYYNTKGELSSLLHSIDIDTGQIIPYNSEDPNNKVFFYDGIKCKMYNACGHLYKNPLVKRCIESDNYSSILLLKDMIQSTIVDFLPFYNSDNKLRCVVFKNSDGEIDYIDMSKREVIARFINIFDKMMFIRVDGDTLKIY